MAQTINKMQVRQSRFDSTKMTDLNHWTKNAWLKPTVFGPAEQVLFSSRTNTLNFTGGNILESLFGANVEEIDNLNFSWEAKVKGFRPLTILENRTPGDFPGKHRQEIKVLVDEDLAAIGETWYPGTSDKSQVLILKRKIKEGRGYLYTFQTYTEGSEHYIKPEYLEPGNKEWTRFYTMRGEAAESGGHTERYTNIEYMNSLVKLRKQYKVTDFASQAVLDIIFEDNYGKRYRSWMDMQEAEYRMAMKKEIAMHGMYSRYGDAPIIDPDSGYPINPGAGIEQQIEFGGNVERYTDLTAELIEAFFDRLVYSRISPGDLGEVIGWSGHYGMKEFSKALDEWSGGKAIVRESPTFIKNDPRGVHNNSLRVGYQFTTYDLPNGGSFKLIHNPLNDATDIHREIDPLTGYPLQSQRITILDITGGNGQSINKKNNISLMKKRNVYGVTIVEGRYGPGGVISKNPKHSGDYYRVDISDSIGIKIKDPTVTGELIKAIN